MVDPVSAASALLPAFVRWGSALYIPVAFFVGWASTALAVRIGMPRAPKPSDPWPDRARAAYPARSALGFAIVFLPLIVGMGVVAAASPFSALPTAVLAPGAALAALVGAEQARPWLDRAVGIPSSSLPARLRTTASAALTYAPHILTAPLGWWLWHAFHSWFALAALIPILAFGAMGGGLFVASALGLAKPASRQVTAVVLRACARQGIRPPAAYELPWRVANALAFPMTRAIAFTRRALELLTDPELEAVTLHELAHLTEPASVRWGRFAVGLLIGLVIACAPAIATLGWSAFGVIVLLVVGLIVGIRRVGRAMEKRADSQAAALSTECAAALGRLYEANLSPAVMRKGALHPSLYDRLAAAGAPPNHPRPLPPSQIRTMLAMVALTGGVMLMVVGHAAAWSQNDWQLYRLATFSTESTLGNYALSRFDGGDLEGSAVLYRACAELYRGIYCPANLSLVEVRLGHCREAAASVSKAVTRIGANPTSHERLLIRSAQRAVATCTPQPEPEG